MKIDGAIPQQFFSIIAKAALEGLNAGDLIQGRVAALENGLLLVKLLDGSSFSASVPEGFIASPGTSLTLQIEERTGDQLTARIVGSDTEPVKSSEPEERLPQINRHLEALGRKATEALVSRVLGLLDENPGLGVDKAAFLTANGMESDQAMQEMMIKLAEREFNLDANLRTLSRFMTDTLSTTDKTGMDNLLKSVFVEMETEQALRDLAGKLVALHSELSEDGVALRDDGTPLLARELMNAIKDSVKGDIPLDAGRVTDALKVAFSAFIAKQNLSSESHNIPDSRLNEIFRDFIESMAGIRAKTSELVQQGSPDIARVIEQLLETACVRVEDGRSEPIDLEEKMEALKHVITLATESAKLAGGKSGQTIQPVVQELSNALQFFSQVNTYHVFVQIPLIINNQQTTGELYIMKRKSRRGRIDANQFTLFISLHTQNLGLVETFLNASHRCVTVHFRVEDAGLSDFVKAHYKVLYEALDQKGYKLAEMKCRVFSDTPTNLLNAGKVSEAILGMNARVDLKI